MPRKHRVMGLNCNQGSSFLAEERPMCRWACIINNGMLQKFRPSTCSKTL